MKTKSLHVSINPVIVDRIDYLKEKYQRSKPAMVEKMLTLVIELERDGKVVL